jgi:hypothetical protein
MTARRGFDKAGGAGEGRKVGEVTIEGQEGADRRNATQGTGQVERGAVGGKEVDISAVWKKAREHVKIVGAAVRQGSDSGVKRGV